VSFAAVADDEIAIGEWVGIEGHLEQTLFPLASQSGKVNGWRVDLDYPDSKRLGLLDTIGGSTTTRERYHQIRFPSILKVVRIIQPETLVRWHRAGFRCYWRWKSLGRGGRPQIETELRALIPADEH
jgi:hypothetical protein